MYFLIIAVAFAPGLFWLWYFFRKDKLHPEPLYLIRKCFLWGMAAIIPAGFFELSFGFVSSFWQFVFIAPIIEELIKLSLYMYNYGRYYHDHSYTISSAFQI